jgi:hypothetical protein
VKLLASYETEVYETETGYVRIDQKDWLDDSQSVLLTPAQAKILGKELMRLAKFGANVLVKSDESGE